MRERTRSMNKMTGMIAVAGLIAMPLMSGCAPRMFDGNDLPEVATFLDGWGVTEADVEMAERLRGMLEERREELIYEGLSANPISVDAYIEALRNGKWPDAKDGWIITDDAHDPKIWIRLSRYAVDEMERLTGEDWELLSLSYQDAHSRAEAGRNMVWQQYDSADFTLIGMSEKYRGCIVEATYQRGTDWIEPSSSFKRESEMQDALDKGLQGHTEADALTKQLEDTEGTTGWDVFCSPYGTVWAMPPADDPDAEVPASFVSLAKERHSTLYLIPRSDTLNLTLSRGKDSLCLRDVPLDEAKDWLASGACSVDGQERVDLSEIPSDAQGNDGQDDVNQDGTSQIGNEADDEKTPADTGKDTEN